MKPWIYVAGILAVACLVGLFVWGSGLAQTGGTFALTWTTTDGGGGLSIGGTFALQGTAGQPDAANHSGGDFRLSGGFWVPGGPYSLSLPIVKK